ncbi:hypothetical protein [Pseudomonas sp. RIT-To-2]|uniref:hypothetical protein n=1 Tax=Pseudomonas sp. RIT-To-2 TaxID=3462541 RepID=UPI002413016C
MKKSNLTFLPKRDEVTTETIDRHRLELDDLLKNMASCLDRLTENTKANRILSEFIVKTTEQLDTHIQDLQVYPEASIAIHDALKQIMTFTVDVTAILASSAEQILTVNTNIEKAMMDASRLSINDSPLKRSFTRINTIREDVENIRSLLNITHQHQQVLTAMFRQRDSTDKIH